MVVFEDVKCKICSAGYPWLVGTIVATGKNCILYIGFSIWVLVFVCKRLFCYMVDQVRQGLQLRGYLPGDVQHFKILYWKVILNKVF